MSRSTRLFLIEQIIELLYFGHLCLRMSECTVVKHMSFNSASPSYQGLTIVI